jgi:hypothetical protein
MNRQTVLILVVVVCIIAAVSAGWAIRRDRGGDAVRDPDDSEIRVRFVCCDDHGNYSPGIYMRCGGGRWAFDTVRKASPFMRAGDPNSAAAGLCGFLFKEIGYQGETAGTLSLDPPPQPGSDGTIDWKAYGGDADVIVINVDKRSATCCFGTVAGQEVHDLPLGGSKPDRR